MQGPAVDADQPRLGASLPLTRSVSLGKASKHHVAPLLHMTPGPPIRVWNLNHIRDYLSPELPHSQRLPLLVNPHV
jgi:hypothetical protein